MKHSESLINIAPALRKAQGAIEGAVKDMENPFFKSKYADLESCWEAVKSPLQAQGLSIVQTMGFLPEIGPTLITTLLHESGEFISGEQPLCAKGMTPQELGSAISYARRYGLSAIVGLVQLDDDGHAASQQKPQQTDPENPGSYVIKVGQHAGKRIDQIPDLAGWVRFHSQNKKLNGPMLEAFTAAKYYLDSQK